MQFRSLIPPIIITFLISWQVFAQAQNRELDSLNQLIIETSDALKKSQLLNQLSLALIPTDIELAGKAADQSIDQAKKVNNKLQVGWSLLSKGICLQIQGDYEGAEATLEEISRLNRKLKNARLEAYATNLKANHFRDRGFFDSALSTYEKARVIMARENDTQFNIYSRLELTRYFLILNENERASQEIDAALTELIRSPSRSLSREAFLLKAKTLIQKYKYDEAEKYLKKAEDLSEKNTTSFLRVQATKGDIRFIQGDFPDAIEIWKKILDAEKQIGYKHDLAMLLLSLAEAYSEQGYRKISTEYLNTCLELCNQSGFEFIKSEALFELAWIAYREGDFKLAAARVKDAEKHPTENNMPVWIAASNNLKGLICMGKNLFDSSLYYHNLALSTRLKSKREVAISSSLFNMGELFVNRKEFRKAVQYLQEGLKIDESINDNYGKSLYYYQLSKAYQGLNQPDSVNYFLNKSISIAVPNSAYEILRKSYLDMARFLQKTEKTNEAINYLEKYISIGDSLYNKQTQQTLAAYETLFEVDKKAKEIELLNKDKELAEANNQTQKVILYMLAVVLFILTMLAFFYQQTGTKLKVLNKANELKAKELAEANSSLTKLYSDLRDNHQALTEAWEKINYTQNQLLKSEKMASLGVLAAGIAHELNNPLNFIKGGVTTLEMHLKKENASEHSDLQTSLKIISEGVNRASSILKGLGQYSRQTDKMDEQCDLHKIIDNCLVILSNGLKYHVKVIKNYSEIPLYLKGNEGKLHQVFINMIANAEQAISGEGTIIITTKEEKNKITVSISDTGIGISPENINRLGDLFFTTKDPGKGTGLGLSISYKIIADHQGKVAVQSEPGKGTTFTIIFEK